METYLTLLYLTLEQEVALKEFFIEQGWNYCKPDLSILTSDVGPPKTPSSYKTKSGKIITCVSLDNGETRTKAKTKHTKVQTAKTRGQQMKQQKRISETDTVKLEVGEALDGSQLSDNHEDIASEIVTETDDGDNDDDFADAMEETVEENTGQESGGSVQTSSVGKQKPARKFPKISAQKEGPSASSNDSATPMPARKKRRVAMETEKKIEAIVADEQVEREAEKPLVDKEQLRSLLLEALSTSSTGKESAKDDFCTCPHCDKSVRNTNMRRHLLTHLDLPYKCTRCTMFFRTEAEQQAHNEKKHSSILECDQCEGKYRSRAALLEHVRIQHEGAAKTYECDICGVKMLRQCHLDDHMNTHMKSAPYSCPTCFKSYNNRSAFKRHVTECGTGLLYKCDECGKILSTVVGLKDHKRRAHDDSFAIYCLCGEKFKSRSARCRHRLNCEVFKKQDFKKCGPRVERVPLTGPIQVLRHSIPERSGPLYTLVVDDPDDVEIPHIKEIEKKANYSDMMYDDTDCDYELEEGEIVIVPAVSSESDNA